MEFKMWLIGKYVGVVVVLFRAFQKCNIKMSRQCNVKNIVDAEMADFASVWVLPPIVHIYI